MRFTLILLALTVLGVLVGAVTHSTFKEEKTEPVVAEPNEVGLCFKELLQYGDNMSWSETSAGRYDYTLYSTSQGIEVWVPCK